LNFYVIASETEWSEVEDAPLACNPLMLSTLRIARQRRTYSFGKKRLAMTEKKCSIYARLQYKIKMPHLTNSTYSKKITFSIITGTEIKKFLKNKKSA
jgi:hypothetical protein